MSACVESLEGRMLFANVVGAPSAVQFPYDALVIDLKRLNTGVADAAKALAVDKRALSADVRALGKGAANTQLLRQAEAAGARSVNALAAATARYAAAAKPLYNRVAIAATLFIDLPSPATSKRLAAAQAALDVVQGKQYTTLLSTATRGPAPYTAALAALATANPSANQLATDVQSATNAQSTLSTTENALVTKVRTDATSLINAG